MSEIEQCLPQSGGIGIAILGIAGAALFHCLTYYPLKLPHLPAHLPRSAVEMKGLEGNTVLYEHGFHLMATAAPLYPVRQGLR